MFTYQRVNSHDMDWWRSLNTANRQKTTRMLIIMAAKKKNFYSGELAHILCHGQKLDQIICAVVKTWYVMVIQHDIMGIISQVPSHSTSLLMVVYGGNYMVAFVVWPSPRFLAIIQFEGVYIYIYIILHIKHINIYYIYNVCPKKSPELSHQISRLTSPWPFYHRASPTPPSRWPRQPPQSAPAGLPGYHFHVFWCLMFQDHHASQWFLLMYFNDFSQQVFHVLDLHIFLFMCKQNLPRFMACLSLHEHTVGPSGAPWMGKWVEHQARFEVFNGAYEYMHS